MASLLRMPGISADSEEATLLEWLVSDGAEVQAGDAVATVETDKAEVDIDAGEDAVVWRTLAEPGSSVTVGSPIAVLLEVGEEVDDEAAVLADLGLGDRPREPESDGASLDSADDRGTGSEAGKGDGSATDVAAASEPVDSDDATTHGASADATKGRRIFVSPISRRLAREHGINIEEVSGSGPGGRIVRADIEGAIARKADKSRQAPEAPSRTAESSAAASPAPAAPAARSATRNNSPYTEVATTSLQRAVASRLAESKREAPHFYLDAVCRVDALLELRAAVNEHSDVRVSLNDFVVKAVAKSLRETPDMNVMWAGDVVRRFESADVAVAIASSRGLVTPVIRGADQLSVTQIATQVRDLAERANSGALKQHELEGGTFTVSNLGMFAVERFTAVINPPQVGILAVGAVTATPVVGTGGGIEAGQTLAVTVSADHRPVDGVIAARWLQRFKQLLEAPLTILV